jgi:hypothetical protein
MGDSVEEGANSIERAARKSSGMGVQSDMGGGDEVQVCDVFVMAIVCGDCSGRTAWTKIGGKNYARSRSLTGVLPLHAWILSDVRRRRSW